MSSTEKFIVLSSDDKDGSSPSNSDFTITLKETYYTQNISRIQIKEVIVPNCFYNISDGDQTKGNGPANNQLILQSTINGQIIFNLDAGQYNIIQLMSTLQTVMNNILSGFGDSVVITRNDITNLLTFTFAVGSYAFNSSSSIAKVLGFYDSISDGPPGTTVYTLPYPPDLSGINTVYLHSRILSDSCSIDASFGLINMFESISMHNVPYGTFAYKLNPDNELATINYMSPRNLSKIDIRLRDREGNRLDIGTKRLSVVIKVYYYI